jgi:FAD binding domain
MLRRSRRSGRCLADAADATPIPSSGRNRLPGWVSSPAKRLLMDKDAVQGAVVDTPDGELTIRASRETILAAGGFPADADGRRELSQSG